MYRRLKSIAAELGRDAGLRWNYTRFIISAVGTPLVALLVLRTLTQVEQGFYYTFNAIVALQVLFELGFAVCITHFTSNAAAKAKEDHRGGFSEEHPENVRLLAIGRLALRWYTILAVLCTGLLLVAGCWFFSSKDYHVEWFYPWLLTSLGTGVSLVFDVMSAIFNGLNRVVVTAKFGIIRNVTRLTLTIVILLLGGGLYSIGVGALMGNVLGLAMFLLLKGNVLKGMWQAKGTTEISWKKEILPMQWRIGASWVAGYVIFWMVNPLIFHYSGAVAAGQFGISWALAQGISAFAQVPINTRLPIWGFMLAKKEYTELRHSWWKTLGMSLGLGVLAGGGLLAAIAGYGHFVSGPSRFLPLGGVLALIINVIIGQYTFAVAGLARTERREPFLMQSLCGAVWVGAGTWVALRYWGVTGVCWMYLAAAPIFTPWTELIRRKTEAFGSQ